MQTILFSNRAKTTLAGPISAGTTSINVAAGDGALFPNPNPADGEYFVLTVYDAATKLNYEIMWVTAVSGDTFTVERGKEGTTAQSWLAGDIAALLDTAGTMDAMVQTYTLQRQRTNYAVDTGTLNNIVVTLDPAPPSLAWLTGAPIRVLVAHTNTGSVTINVNGLGATVVHYQAVGGTLGAYDLIVGGIYEFVFDGTYFQVDSAQVLRNQTNTWTQFNTFTQNVTVNANITTTAGAIYSSNGFQVGPTPNPIPSTTNGFAVIANGTFQAYNSSTSVLGLGIGFSGAIVNFYYGSTGVGSISTNGSATAYNTTSDARLKEVFGPADAAWLDAIPVHDAQFRDKPATRRPMLLAHELAAVAPWAVTGERDAVDEDGRPVYQQVDYAALIPALIARVRAMAAEIEELKQRNP